MDLVDTHCHIQSVGLDRGETSTRELWSKQPDLTRQDLIKDAVETGVTKMIAVGCELEDSKLAIEFVKDQPNCWASIGLHPHEAKLFAGEQAKLEEFAKLAKANKVVAIGECGFDFYYNHSPKQDQVEVLRFQIELALEHNLPMIFHVREAFDDFWPIFDSYKGIRGVLHSFTDSTYNLAKAIERDLFIGVNGISTFAKNPDQIEVYRTIPLSNLLLETDSPFLTPIPYRGAVNTPAKLNSVADFLCELRNENREELVGNTTYNACKLFKI